MQKSGNEPRRGGEAVPRTRGRPRAFDRERALAEGMRVFWQKGYEATSIADLTGAMRINSPSLYAAFGSKEELYAECIRHYGETYKPLGWDRFFAARTAREAVECFLLDSAALLTGCLVDVPRGCMVTLSTVGSEGHAELGALVSSARAATLERLRERLERGVAEGDIPAGANTRALARFVQSVQYGMSVLARDGASRGEMEEVARMAMLGWDERGRGIDC